MFIKQLTIILFVTILSSVVPAVGKAKSVDITNLKTEYSSNPMGIDIAKPRFSWQMSSSLRGIGQKAFVVKVKDESGRLVWDSGKINSATSLNIRYNGLPLKPTTRYFWKVLVWDTQMQTHESQSWFETGLMSSANNSRSWNMARWIGMDDKDLNLYSQYLPVFKLSYSVQIDSSSHQAGFVFGANDPRLMDKGRNEYSLANKRDSSYILVELDLSSLNEGDAAKFNIFRSGYSPKDNKDSAFKTFSISKSLLNKSNQYGKHTFLIDCVLGDAYFYLNERKTKNLIGHVNLNPLGRGGDFIAFPVCADIGFYVPAGQKAFFSDVSINNYRHPSNTLFKEELSQLPYHGIFSPYGNQLSVERSGYRVSGSHKPALILADPSHSAMPMMRTVFKAGNKKIAKARLYATARGIYDVYINGKRISNDYFNPGLSQYNKTQFYQTFDVTKYINSGNNAIGAILGEGWWSGGATYIGEFWNFFGDRQSLLAQLIITYQDGSEQIITSQPGAWKYNTQGPLIYGSLFQGEVYDARKLASTARWSNGDFKDENWTATKEILLSNTINADSTNRNSNLPMVNDYQKQLLIGQYGEAVRKVRELKAVGVEQIRPGVFIYDMGQNFAGVPSISLDNIPPATKLVLRYAEVKYPDLPEYQQQKGMLMLENIRAAMAQDIYITKGGKELIEPRFTYHGYRYIEISGLDKALELSAVRGSVLSSVHSLASQYQTSSKSVNKLWENTTWSMLSNFISIPTDCPQRNERLGWSGDISVFSKTATYLSNIPQFLRKHMQAMRDVQREDGRFSDVAPLGGGFGGVLWGSAGINVAWESYQQYGDLDLLTEHYKAMKKYITFLISGIDSRSGILNERDRVEWSSLGDWLSPEYSKTEKTILWDAYFISDLQQLSRIAAILNQKNDVQVYNNLVSRRIELFRKNFIIAGKTAYKGQIVDTQASYVLPLSFNILTGADLDSARKNLKQAVARTNKTDDGKTTPPYSLMTGFISTSLINSSLSDNGHSDIAYKLLQQTSYPSWLYPVTQGATTIWERLNSYTHSDGFGGNNRMNSFNHYSFGAVGSWMYDHSLGMKRDKPGFKHFYLQPEPDPSKDMTFAKGYYDSMYGRIESSWRYSEKGIYYRFVVPANTSATLMLTASSKLNITEKGKPLYQVEHVKYIGKTGNMHSFELPSGTFEIFVNVSE
ncbi:family 78 glycoside hydrolase catalytic domain [Pedobacter agri]|uniref:family 78 glycoside hydrolase catalytic domain n=1 Tax=Pedobacter agri TaxID=454586 RepID=UPI00292E3F96|nr:family 78 glycoside hydrolase catalytic domain [Pedobacter agri]